MQDKPLAIIPAKTDKDYATELKVRTIEAYKPVLEIMNEAMKNEFQINVACGPDGLGIVNILQLIVSKVYK